MITRLGVLERLMGVVGRITFGFSDEFVRRVPRDAAIWNAPSALHACSRGCDEKAICANCHILGSRSMGKYGPHTYSNIYRSCDLHIAKGRAVP